MWGKCFRKYKDLRGIRFLPKSVASRAVVMNLQCAYHSGPFASQKGLKGSPSLYQREAKYMPVKLLPLSQV